MLEITRISKYACAVLRYVWNILYVCIQWGGRKSVRPRYIILSVLEF